MDFTVGIVSCQGWSIIIFKSVIITGVIVRSRCRYILLLCKALQINYTNNQVKSSAWCRVLQHVD